MCHDLWNLMVKHDHYDDVGNSSNMSQWAAELYLPVPHDKLNILLLNSSTWLIWNLKYTETKQEYNDLLLYSWLIIIIIAYLSEIQKVALSPQSSICPILTIRYWPTTLLIFHTQYQATGCTLKQVNLVIDEINVLACQHITLMPCSMIVLLQDSVESIKSIISYYYNYNYNKKPTGTFTTAKKISELLVVSQWWVMERYLTTSQCSPL